MRRDAGNNMTDQLPQEAQNKDHTKPPPEEKTNAGAGSNLPNQESALGTSSSSPRVAKLMQLFGTSKE